MKNLIFILILVFVYLWSIGSVSAEPIGEIHIAGNTWCEMQWGSSNVDEMIALDTVDNTIHIVWTYAPPPPYELARRSYYNSFNPETGWFVGEPGYDMFAGDVAHTNHAITVTDYIGGRNDIEITFHSRVQVPGEMRAWWEQEHFERMQLDTIPPGKVSVRAACGRNGIVQMVGASPWWPAVLYYGKYDVDPFAFLGWYFVDTVSYAHDIATSPVSDRVAFSYLRQKRFDGNPNSNFDQDVYYMHSPDGFQWDWQDKVDITHFSEDDIFRPIADIDIIMDYNDQIHIAFTTYEAHIDSNFPESTTVNPNMSFIWHWSEETDSFSVAADGWIQDPPDGGDFGLWRYPVDKPQMAINPVNDHIYLLYERHSYDDLSSGLYANTDLWVSVSTDNGLNWSVGTNITDTPTPHCYPGNCASEIQASIHNLANDTLHIVYILDKDAGMWQMGEGALMESEIVYQKIPTNLIPTEPLLPQFSIRSDPRTAVWEEPALTIPGSISLSQNYPNPFNAETVIYYNVSEPGYITLSVYNLLGQKEATLFDGKKQAGKYRAFWDASDFPSGVYFARLETPESSRAIKMVLLK